MSGETLAELRRIGVRPIIVLDVPEAGYNVPYTLARAMLAGREPVDISPSRAAVERRGDRATEIVTKAAAAHGAEIVEPDPYFCDAETCHVVRDGVPLYRDSDHITRATALALSPLFDPAFGGEDRARP